MTDHQQILAEEFESCPTGASRYESNPTTLPPRIPVSPQLPPHLTRTVSLHLIFTYPPTYPDVLPDMEFESIDEDSGELDDAESELVLGRLRTIVSCRERSMAKEQGEESLGMALTFTLASAAGDVLKDVIKGRLKRENDDYERRAREYEEAEASRTRGTPLTPQAFDTWRKGFVNELKAKRDKEEEERIKALPPKEKEEYRRRRERLSGKQLFETSQTLATSDEALYEEGTGEVDLAQYSREERERERRREEEEEDRRRRGLVNTGEESDGD